MNILYTDKNKKYLMMTWQIQHNLIVNAKNIGRVIMPAHGDAYTSMLGAKYHGRPFDYFRDMLTDYIKR